MTFETAYITDDIAEELSIDISPRITVACDCGTVTTYYQDSPGHRCFDPVPCDGCGITVGKT